MSRSGHHYHAENTTLDADDAAQCVYASRVSAIDMVETFIKLAGMAKATIREIGDHQYTITEHGKTYDVGLRKCSEDGCATAQRPRGRP